MSGGTAKGRGDGAAGEWAGDPIVFRPLPPSERGPPCEVQARGSSAGGDQRHSADQPSTSRFYNARTKRYFRALLDYVMVSPGLVKHAPEWRIWHPFEDARCYADVELREALLAASDHFPVCLDIELT